MVTMAVEEESPVDKTRVYNKKSNLIVKACFVLSSQKRVSLRKRVQRVYTQAPSAEHMKEQRKSL